MNKERDIQGVKVGESGGVWGKEILRIF